MGIGAEALVILVGRRRVTAAKLGLLRSASVVKTTNRVLTLVTVMNLVMVLRMVLVLTETT